MRWGGSVMSTELSGVIACRSISTPRPHTVSRKSPFKVWPEVEDWLTYYTLPRVNAIYYPEDEGVNSEDLGDFLIRHFPQLELFRYDLGWMIKDYYFSHYDPEFIKCDSAAAAGNVVSILLNFLRKNGVKGDPYHSASVHLTESSEHAFSLTHEWGHLLSLQIMRPPILEFKITSLRIEELLLLAGSSADFWDKFIDLNRKLSHCLFTSLALEELRANIFTFGFPGYQEKFMNQVYKKGIEGIDSEIFYALHSLTGGVATYGIYLTWLAECCDPANPVKALAELLQMLKEEGAETWSEEQWWSWFISCKSLDEWDAVTMDLGEKRDSSFIEEFLPSAVLAGSPNGVVNVSCTKTMRLPLFLESMRQQLLHWDLVGTLTCPFKGQLRSRRSCCGCGDLLRNIWAAIPDEKRRKLKLPSKICLQSVPIDPL
jgi:hypothetical protein